MRCAGSPRESCGAIFSVDVLGEGVDVPSVDTVLLLRPTDSATVFTQQLGRGLRRSEGSRTSRSSTSSGSSTVSSASSAGSARSLIGVAGRCSARSRTASRSCPRGRMWSWTDRASKSFLATSVMRFSTLSGNRWSPICVTPGRVARSVFGGDRSFTGGPLSTSGLQLDAPAPRSTRDRCCNHRRKRRARSAACSSEDAARWRSGASPVVSRGARREPAARIGQTG